MNRIPKETETKLESLGKTEATLKVRLEEFGEHVKKFILDEKSEEKGEVNKA